MDLGQTHGPFLMIGNPEIHIHTALGLGREAFTDLVIMLGGDFSGRLPGVSPEKAYELIKKYGTIENILEDGILDHCWDAALEKNAYLDKLPAARIAYGTLPPVPPLHRLGPRPKVVSAVQQYYRTRRNSERKTGMSANGFPTYTPATINEIFASIAFQPPSLETVTCTSE